MTLKAQREIACTITFLFDCNYARGLISIYADRSCHWPFQGGPGSF